MPLSAWKGVFADCLEGRDLERLARASVAFDFRQVAGELYVDLRAHRDHARGARPQELHARPGAARPRARACRSAFASGSRACIDIKKHGLVPIQNLARYYAFARGITAHSTVERLIAVRESDGEETVAERSLREAYLSMAHLQLRHHANAIRAGRKPDNDHRRDDAAPADQGDPAGGHARGRGRAEPVPAPGRAALTTLRPSASGRRPRCMSPARPGLLALR